MRACMAWPGPWASAWCEGVSSMKAVAITAIICVTIIILAWMDKKNRR